ncbi:MAG: glycosyltransferase family 2 protein [Candidatus Acidiferrum sp.]
MPLISVVMPLFNAADTLLLALASLQAQACEDWECIVVDDGSTDNPERIIRALCDPRIQYHPLDRNRGRGYARQCGLEIARGRYIAFLDADDWVYPHKLREQMELLESEPDVALVSTGMAISNASDQLVGVRNTPKKAPLIHAPMRHVGMPPFAFAPTMIVAKLAKKTGFDPSFPIAEDVDFLLRALAGERYAILPSPLYVYREPGSATFPKVKSALDYCCQMFAIQFHDHPLASSIQIAKARGKQCIYYSAFAFGLWDYMIARRSQTPNGTDRQQYQNAWKIISEIAAGYEVAA